MTPVRLVTPAMLVGAASTLIAGCSQSSDFVAFENACKDKAGPAVVGEWQKTHDAAPWEVTKIVSTTAKEGSESSSESKVVYVSGTASVSVDESGADTREVSWSCFSQRPEGDTNVTAGIRSVSIN
ncbi:hypothetical protein DEJ34_03920 [Curtobacterium sp. MCPF17_050]|uniref:hypothetical protein n=1 Tax=Curtobacterium sp. MCPF17_050 TaxID=2175664 RepID=UPI000D85DE89|nr:hypothetical protein [Curtobacterium sp. MCPF17_050]WIB16291.1 hypothetical protein DEJ34_03920 [Curtobacterium sp. MCPF17_050]